jgi:hypothetical protein
MASWDDNIAELNGEIENLKQTLANAQQSAASSTPPSPLAGGD